MPTPSAPPCLPGRRGQGLEIGCYNAQKIRSDTVIRLSDPVYRGALEALAAIYDLAPRSGTDVDCSSSGSTAIVPQSRWAIDVVPNYLSFWSVSNKYSPRTGSRLYGYQETEIVGLHRATECLGEPWHWYLAPIDSPL
jgi:hypothetical protein